MRSIGKIITSYKTLPFRILHLSELPKPLRSNPSKEEFLEFREEYQEFQKQYNDIEEFIDLWKNNERSRLYALEGIQNGIHMLAGSCGGLFLFTVITGVIRT